MAYKRRLSGEETPTKASTTVCASHPPSCMHGLRRQHLLLQCYEELVPSFKRMRTADPTAEQVRVVLCAALGPCSCT
jgi:hypothetical protein